MAKTSMINRDIKRKKIAKKFETKRAALKKTISNPKSSYEEKADAQVQLQKLPRDASPVRYRNRDSIDGRPRGNLSRYGISRVRFRDMAHRGELPGITKSSW